MNKSKIAILTNFMEFNPGYSLTGIVQDQVKMFQSQGHPVKLFVNSQYNMTNHDKDKFDHNVSEELPPVDLYRDVPFSHLIDYTSINDLSDHHKEIAQQTKDVLVKELKDVQHVLCHDLTFQGWHLPYGIGTIAASKELPDTKFYHWVHSTPSSNRDWWDFGTWGRNHKIIFPNKTEQVRVAEQYKTMPKNVACIPHIKDLRTWNDFSQDSNDFISDHPEVLSSDIVQIYPISSDRLGAKRLDIVLEIFSHFKKMGYRICLVIANQWATGRQRKEDIKKYIQLAESLGLENDKDFIFTSEWDEGKYDTGIPKQMLRDLATCSNMFIFPTREESFGLVGAEIPLSTACITITNRSLAMMKEIHGGFTDSYHFGSFDHNFTAPDHKKYYKDIAQLAHSTFRLNDVVLHRTFLRQRYNWNHLYQYYYVPLMSSNF